jgi:hypothetical protein
MPNVEREWDRGCILFLTIASVVQRITKRMTIPCAPVWLHTPRITLSHPPGVAKILSHAKALDFNRPNFPGRKGPGFPTENPAFCHALC